MNEPTMENVEKRLERLERKGRWWRMLAVTVVIPWIFLLIGATQQEKTIVADKIQTKEFVLVNDDGKQVVCIGAPGDRGPYLILAYPKKKNKTLCDFSAKVPQRGPLLELLTEEGSIRLGRQLGIGLVIDGGLGVNTSLNVFGSRASISLSSKHRFFDISLLDNVRENSGNVSLRLSETGWPAEYGQRRRQRQIAMEVSSDGSSAIEIYDKDENKRAVLGSTSLETTRTGAITKTAESSLVLFDKKGKVIWNAP